MALKFKYVTFRDTENVLKEMSMLLKKFEYFKANYTQKPALTRQNCGTNN